jgi:Uma2 family endonuclease
MPTLTLPRPPDPVVYPDSDGLPMSDNTRQFRWILTLYSALEERFAADPNVFVAGDLLWYPVEGRADLRAAPDAMVALGRPKGDRGSYRQWLEGGVAPQVVFEVVSPGNSPIEMLRKLHFYEKYGVQEYGVYDPDRNEFEAYARVGDRLQPASDPRGWTSPLLGMRFAVGPDGLEITQPDGSRYLPRLELVAEWERERSRAERLAQRLRELGVEVEE